jgi:hypothetical protein
LKAIPEGHHCSRQRPDIAHPFRWAFDRSDSETGPSAKNRKPPETVDAHRQESRRTAPVQCTDGSGSQENFMIGSATVALRREGDFPDTAHDRLQFDR